MKRLFFFFLFAHTASQAMELATTSNPSLATQLCYEGVKSKNLLKVQLGLAQGADCNYIDGFGDSLLSIACHQKHEEISEELLAQDNIDVTSAALFEACNDDNMSSIVQIILTKDPDTATTRNNHENIPLHGASYCLNKKCIQFLITSKPDSINYQNNKKETPLHLACLTEKRNTKEILETVKLLTLNGADATITDESEATPLFYLFNLFCAKQKQFYNFMTENMTIAKKLIHKKDSHGNSQLHLCAILPFAVENVCKDYVSFLLTNGLSLLSKNNDDKTPIDRACEYRDLLQECYVEEKAYIEALAMQECIIKIFLSFLPKAIG